MGVLHSMPPQYGEGGAVLEDDMPHSSLFGGLGHFSAKVGSPQEASFKPMGCTAGNGYAPSDCACGKHRNKAFRWCI